MTNYNQNFYDSTSAGSIASARIVLSLLFDWLKPLKVIDVGCGTGTWLSVASKMGSDVLGIDGAYAIESGLRIEPSNFLAHDLQTKLPDNLGQFDLALCMEVGEHLPADRAKSLVEDLCKLSPAVCFSAAVPYQAGHSHVNEQWPEYWIELFELQGMNTLDVIRPRVWGNREVEPWYQQNAFLFVTDQLLSEATDLKYAVAEGFPFPRRVVHPDLFYNHLSFFSPHNVGVKRAWREFVSAVTRACRKRISR